MVTGLGEGTRNMLIAVVGAGALLALMGVFKWYGFEGPFRVAGTDTYVTFGDYVSDGFAVLILGVICAVAAIWQFRRDRLSRLGVAAMIAAAAGAFAISYNDVMASGDVCSWQSSGYLGIFCLTDVSGDTASVFDGGRVLPPLWIALASSSAIVAVATAVPVIEHFFPDGGRADTNETTKPIDGALQW